LGDFDVLEKYERQEVRAKTMRRGFLVNHVGDVSTQAAFEAWDNAVVKFLFGLAMIDVGRSPHAAMHIVHLTHHRT